MRTIEAWLQAARADAERQGHTDVVPVLDALAQAAMALRRADWNADATDRVVVDTPTPPSTPVHHD